MAIAFAESQYRTIATLTDEVRPAWERHINGLGHVSRMTVNRFVCWKYPAKAYDVRDGITEVLWGEYCDAKQAAQYDADIAANEEANAL